MEREPHPICGTITIRSTVDNSLENTCSGFLLDSKLGYFLTHGTVLSEHLHIKSKVFKELKKKLYSSVKQTLGHLQVTIQLPKIDLENFVSISLNTDLKTSLSNAVLEGLRENQCTQFSGSVHSLFCVPSLRTLLKKLMPPDNWEFADDLSKKSKEDQSKSLIFHNLLSCFVLIKLHDWVPFHSIISTKSSSGNFIGDPVEIISTPFGGLNPEVFLNSRSAGIISNTAGKHKVLLMTDARCVPGSEGGILLERKRSRSVIGVMIATLCWKNNEWVGLSMACALPEILKAVDGIPIDISPAVLNIAGKGQADTVLQQVVRSVPMISVRGSWGSGFTVGIHGDEVILLTCSHVVKDCSHTPAKIKWPSGNVYSGKLLYRNFTSPAFDLALLSVKVNAADLPSTLKTSKVEEGEAIFGVGHAIFNEEYDLLPSATSGTVSKILRIKNQIVMLQTTCAIHAGASGGPIINRQGKVVGVTVCNAKDVSAGASYPHINMCVPMETVLPIIEKFLQSKDVSVLEQLHVKDPLIKVLWALETKNTGHMISSRL
ncbi:peroxisomal leader peptide-processing protease-like [Saccostrea echinata]|uniref:peroxisomal leader peptide-processing protease-like n=1 Tax=Saccostrea echinata TaxID=191078 RepID=UPI002A81EB17|nr:peroxisomal leader peptide-processing protease-like [Saccostrea echinata]